MDEDISSNLNLSKGCCHFCCLLPSERHSSANLSFYVAVVFLWSLISICHPTCRQARSHNVHKLHNGTLISLLWRFDVRDFCTQHIVPEAPGRLRFRHVLRIWAPQTEKTFPGFPFILFCFCFWLQAKF